MKLSEIIKQKGDREIFDFEKTGRAYRLISSILGGCTSTEGRDKVLFYRNGDSVEEYLYRRVIWWYSDWETPKNTKEKIEAMKKRVVEAVTAMNEAGLKPFYYSDNSISIHILDKGWFIRTAFRGSDDPEVWKKNQKVKEDNRKIEQVKKSLDGGR